MTPFPFKLPCWAHENFRTSIAALRTIATAGVESAFRQFRSLALCRDTFRSFAPPSQSAFWQSHVSRVALSFAVATVAIAVPLVAAARGVDMNVIEVMGGYFLSEFF